MKGYSEVPMAAFASLYGFGPQAHHRSEALHPEAHCGRRCSERPGAQQELDRTAHYGSL
jgi:hypothetical protein